MKRTRALLALMPVALVAGLLTSCSASPTSAISGVECAPEGEVSKSIEVEGKFGEADPKLKTKTPIKATKLETSTLIKGDGDQVKENDALSAQLTIFDGETGDTVSTEASVLELNPEKILPWALEIVACSSIGDRVVAAAPVADVLGENAANFGLETTGSLVMVFDLLSVEKSAASDEECAELTPRDSKYPKVDLGEGTSEPKITIPSCMEPPAELELKVLVEGDGPVVAADQNIMTNYVGVDWNGAVRFDGNWTETGILFSTAEGALIPGFTQAMVGQKVGSTILVTVPSDLGYQDGMTRTFVLQLVAVAPAQ